MTYSNNPSRPRTNNRISDRGLPLTIHDISTYIKTNAKFINQTHVNAYDDIDDYIERDTLKTIEPLRPGQESDLLDLPENLDHIFGSYDFRRKSVLSEVKTPTNTNVTFVSALLNGAIVKYDNYKDKVKIDLTEKMIRKCLKEYQLAFENLRYETLGWNPKDLRKTVSTFTINRELLRYFVDMLYVNLFILDIENDRLSYVGSDVFIKHKKNIFLVKFDNTFEIVFEEGKEGKNGSDRKYVFDYSSGIVKKLINSSYCVEKLDCNYNNSEEDIEFVIGEEVFDLSLDEDTEGSNEGSDQDYSEEGDFSNEYSSEQEVSDETRSNGFDGSDGNGFEEGEVRENEKDYIVGITEAAEFSESGEESGEANESMTRNELVAIAKGLDIDIYYRNKSGKRTAKTKPMLINDINAA